MLNLEPMRPKSMPQYAGAYGEIVLLADFGNEFVNILLVSNPYMVQCQACKESTSVLFNRKSRLPYMECLCGNSNRPIRTNYDPVSTVRSVLLRPTNCNIRPGDYLYEIYSDNSVYVWLKRYSCIAIGKVNPIRLARHYPGSMSLPSSLYEPFVDEGC